ncbi:putative MFS family arabinose efflux permease [Paenibacillus amylolyticus]|uniref:MFS family arabinose efflux permease n=1 Tax=Paenibacillus amylolyticus TaxID=1451 RepID=A0AAP5H440_PAEAM|nr:MFS transporter [Paenibacillus amylolyticus]MDR6723674.1 putative MFS family arabinose efflux permease [Paenibacillus amylolyticus]
MSIQWLVRSQSIVTLASGMIYPYYLLFLKNLGNSFSKYGLAFAVFTISSAAASQWLAPRLDQHAKQWLIVSSLGMAVAMIAFPWVLSYIWVLILQMVMGLCNAMQRMSERTLLADNTLPGQRGQAMGNYHFWTSAASGFAVILGGVLIDWLTIDVLFYLSAALYVGGAWAVGRSTSSVETK